VHNQIKIFGHKEHLQDGKQEVCAEGRSEGEKRINREMKMGERAEIFCTDISFKNARATQMSTSGHNL
jgi:hypothetical protein